MWSPQEGPQADAIAATWCGELFYGGAAGGGKSDFLLGDYLQDVPTYGAAWPGVIFRRTYGELDELKARANEIYPSTGAAWNEQKHVWRWPNGATLKMRYLEADRDVTRYQGHQYAWIGFDELTQWKSLYPWRYLRGRLRSAKPVPTKRMRAAANPGGAGHLEVKSYFIDPAPGGYTPIDDPETGMARMFIPARLRDNRILVANDAGYAWRLAGLGGQLAKAMLDGDWDVVEGAFFDCWSPRLILEPFAVPTLWTRFRSFDWGSAKPFSVGWWAVASDAFEAKNTMGEDVLIPRGALVRYREWYGSTGKPNEGLKLANPLIAEGILERERAAGDTDKTRTGPADPAIFSTAGGPSIAEEMRRAGVHWVRADNTRVAQVGAISGWSEMRRRMTGSDGVPMVYCFKTCRDSIRTIPALQHDPHRPEDLDTTAEDHAADEWRYAFMSRPMIAKPKTPSNDPPDLWSKRRESGAGGMRSGL